MTPDLLETAVPAAARSPGASGRVFTIAELCEAFDVTPRALRFYESRGFIAPRRQGTVRLYGQSDRDRLTLILKAKRLGFTLREIGGLIAGGEGTMLPLSRAQCTEQINLLERQKRAIDHALTELRRTYSEHYLQALAGEEAGRDEAE